MSANDDAQHCSVILGSRDLEPFVGMILPSLREGGLWGRAAKEAVFLCPIFGASKCTCRLWKGVRVNPGGFSAY